MLLLLVQLCNLDSLRTVPTNAEVFLHSLLLYGKADLSKGHWNPKRKLGVTTYFF